MPQALSAGHAAQFAVRSAVRAANLAFETAGASATLAVT